MKQTRIILFLSLISLVCYLTVAYLYVIVWDYKIKGIALALFAYGLCFQICVQITLKCILLDLKEAIFFPTKESFNDWGDWLRLAIPSVIVYFMGAVSYEIYVIASGLND